MTDIKNPTLKKLYETLENVVNKWDGRQDGLTVASGIFNELKNSPETKVLFQEPMLDKRLDRLEKNVATILKALSDNKTTPEKALELLHRDIKGVDILAANLEKQHQQHAQATNAGEMNAQETKLTQLVNKEISAQMNALSPQDRKAVDAIQEKFSELAKLTDELKKSDPDLARLHKEHRPIRKEIKAAQKEMGIG